MTSPTRTALVAGGCALLAAAALLAGCTSSTGDGAPPTTAAPTATATGTAPPAPSASPTATAPAAAGQPTAWFLVDTRAGLRLARDSGTPPAGSPADAVRAAVAAMISGPADPDYTTSWNPDARILDVTVDPGAITVDLSREATSANIGSEGAALMVQQLVWTATEAAGDPLAGVELHIEGAPAGELWGAVVWDGPVVRADAMDVRALVQLDLPREGQVFPAGAVTFTGDAAAFEANVPWRLLDADGVEVDSGATQTSEGQTFSPFSFKLNLPPGRYVIEVREDDPSGGAGGTPMSDTRSFEVE